MGSIAKERSSRKKMPINEKLSTDGGGSRVTGTMTIFKGRMQNISLSDDPDGTSTVVVNAENRLIDLRRPSNLRYTKESQESISSGDTGFNRMQSLLEKKIVWGHKDQSDSLSDIVVDENTEGGKGAEYQQR